MRSAFIKTNNFFRSVLGHRVSQVYQEARHYLKYGDRFFPRSFGIEVSAFCNRVCSYCPNSYTPRAPVDYMSMETFEIVLKRLADIDWVGPVSYQFMGEPLLDKRLPELVRLTRSKVRGALPRIYTNADFLTEDLLRRLIDAGAFNLVVVRHPPFSDEWDRRVIPLIKDKRYSKYFTYNGVLAVGGQPSEKVEDSLHYIQTHPFGGGNETPDIVYTRCPHIMGSYTILRNGDVVQCCLSWDRQPVLGNVREEGLLEIWNKPAFKQIREDVIFNRTPKMDKCKACFGQPVPKLTRELALSKLHPSFFLKTAGEQKETRVPSP